MSNYDVLLNYVRTHAGDVMTLAKTINAWEWAALTGGSLGPVPTSAANVCDTLAASCGWREILMLNLFKQIGVEGRAVNFYNMPFQGNHTTVELKIDGKWVWFDPTFGTYLASSSGGSPLSIEEARAQWPAVKIMASTMDGWQSTFLDPASINPTYTVYSDKYFYRPMASTTIEGVMSGEIRSLYFGGEAGYFIDGVKTPIANPDGLKWITYQDSADKYDWMRHVDAYDKAGKLDYRWGEYDLDSAHFYAWFVDWDQANAYSWASRTDYIGNVRNGVIDYSVEVNDDGSRTVVDSDTAPELYNWSVKTTHVSAAGLSDWQEGIYDSGASWRVEWDDRAIASWAKFTDFYDAAGHVTSTTFVMDDGQVFSVDWSGQQAQASSQVGDRLEGSSAQEYLLGLDGNDVLIGRGGADRLEGGDGDDVYYTYSLDDIIIEQNGGGLDTVRSYGNFVLAPNVENLVLITGIYGTGNQDDNYIVGNDIGNVLSGELGNDTLRGLAGNDILSGGYGNDILEGGLGKDVMSGGYGKDVFLWRNITEFGATLSTADTITDFSPGKNGDKLHLRLVDADVTKAGDQAFTFIGNTDFTGAGQARVSYINGDTVVLLNVDADQAYEGIIRLNGLKTLQATDFYL